MKKSFEHAHSTGAIKIYLRLRRTFAKKNIQRKLEFFQFLMFWFIFIYFLSTTIRVWLCDLKSTNEKNETQNNRNIKVLGKKEAHDKLHK